jgi:hypothetical protein
MNARAKSSFHSWKAPWENWHIAQKQQQQQLGLRTQASEENGGINNEDYRFVLPILVNGNYSILFCPPLVAGRPVAGGGKYGLAILAVLFGDDTTASIGGGGLIPWWWSGSRVVWHHQQQQQDGIPTHSVGSLSSGERW